MSNLKRLYDDFGQSPWLDDLSRDLLQSGTLQEYIDDGIRGLTSNPSILEKAITGSTAYDDDIKSLAANGLSTEDIYRRIVEDDIKHAAALFHPLWQASGGHDGFVSLEVSPNLASDTAATITEAKRLWQEVNLPNLMVKVPATDGGIAAIAPLLEMGINVNVTLIFGLDQYQRVIKAYEEALDTRHETRPSSVASFFVSRIDTEVDKRLEAIGGDALNLRGQAAVASAHLAYEIFRSHFGDKSIDETQRVLWASTSTKNPAYDDLMYVRYLVAARSINTLPEATIAALNDHLSPETVAIPDDYIAHAHAYQTQLQAAGVDMQNVTATLESEGVKKFQDAFATLLAAIDSKRV